VTANPDHDQTDRSTQSGPPQPGPGERLASDEELLERYHASRDPALREELVHRYLGFAKGLALRYRGTSEPPDDLMQVASLGLVNAIDRYDPGRGAPFRAFAAPTILGELKRHFRDRVWTVRVPRGLKERIAEVEEAITKLTGTLQRSPSVQEVAEKLGLDQLEVLEAMEASDTRNPLSLDHPGPADAEEGPPGEWVGEEDDRYEIVVDRASVEGVLPMLSERERLVLRLRFVEDWTQSQIAERIGCSQMHVSRILRRTLQKIREQVSGEEPRGSLSGSEPGP
jgi:RNA polymerase sigma-B factor